MFYIDMIISKLIILIINIIDKTRGTDLPGKIALKLNKNFPLGFKNIDYNKVIFVTGTNGKSTTTNLIHHVLKSNNYSVASNLEGANLIAGITTTLIKNSTLTGKLKPEYFVFEIDERSLKNIHRVIPAKHLVITNLQKDQVHRNADPDFIYRKIKDVVTKDMHLYLNNEEPRSKSFEDFADDITYYSVERNERSVVDNDRLAVTMPCPKCNHKINFNYYNVDNVGNFNCTNCGFKSEDKPIYQMKDVDFENATFTYDGTTFKMPYNVPFMMYNYALVIALGDKLGLTKEQMQHSFNTFINIGGRIETVKYKDKELKYIRIKQENPETLQSAIDVVANDKSEKTFILGLCIIKDEPPHYTNTFYAYDCNFTPLVNSNIKRYIAFSEYVCYDTANRFIYEGVEKDKIDILNTDNVEEILKKVDEADCKNVYLITWLETFIDIKNYVKKNNL